ncbi:MAG: hypothetical protein ACM3O7_09420 [Acidobacteriota bacterium]
MRTSTVNIASGSNGGSGSRPRVSFGPALMMPTAAVLLVLVWTAALFWGVLFRHETFFARDFTAYDRPMMSLQARLWHETPGLPEWNPYLAEGQPFADRPMTSPFQPFAWLLAVLPFEPALAAQVILPRLVALASMLLLLRTLSVRPAAALFGACVWAFGGFMLSTADLVPLSRTVAFIPALLACLVRTGRRPSWGNALGLAVAVALTGLGGEPSALLACVPLALAACAVVLFSTPEAATWRTAAALRERGTKLAAGLALGIFMAAAVLLPAAHLASLSPRSSGLAADELEVWSLAPPRVLEPLLPELLGPVDPRHADLYWGQGWYGEKVFPLVYSFYAGLAAAVLALVALRVSPRMSLPWGAAGAVGLALALGVHMPGWFVLRELVPALLRVRFPEKWLLIPALCGVVLASLALDRLLAGDRRTRRWTVWLFAGAAVTFAAAAGGVAAVSTIREPSYWTRLAVPANLTQVFATALPAGLLRQLLVALACLALVLLLGRRPRALAAGLILLTAADLFAATRGLLPSAPAAKVTQPPGFLAPLVASDHPPRLFHLAAWQPPCSTRRDIAEPLEPAQWGIPLAFELDFDLTELAWTNEATEHAVHMVLRHPGTLEPLLVRRGIGAVARCTLPVNAESSSPPAPEPPVTLTLLPHTSGLATCLERVVRVRDAREWETAVVGLGERAASTAVIDAGVREPFPSSPGPCVVRVLARHPRRVDLGVAAAGPQASVLAINQTWHPGWRARVDGRAATLFRADISLTGIVVPPGDHTVTLSFRDPWVEGSLVVSLAGVGVALALLALVVRRSPSAPAATPPEETTS